MLGNNDKITLTLVNAMDRDGKLLPFSLSLPVGSKDIVIPENVLKIDVFESNITFQEHGIVVFSIYVGKVSTVMSLFNEKKNHLEISKVLNRIKDVDTPICYYTSDDGRNIIFAKVNDNDIVVKDTEELKKVIVNISKHFTKIKNEVSKIKGFNLTHKRTRETK